ncbi:YggT family protein [uncultured Tyzzerella sp.]|uniref:YggT family protein n=1 Tax=uncultured Tyzzerella sp. TaxID=2321398 RepID=UPI0029436024|nr:YggT family protein [uncultured Tyzzerella sp.]
MNILIYKSFEMLLRLIEWIILIRVLLSWIPLDRNNSIVKIIYSLSEPFLYPIRQLLRKSPLGDGLMIDFSPVILFLILQFIQTILANILIG